MFKWLSLISKSFRLLKNKGARYTYNAVHFHLFWSSNNSLVGRLLHWLEPYPSYIEIEVTTRCNLRCVMCEHTYWDEPKRDMSFEEFKGIVDQFPRLRWIGLTGIGESFMNKDFLKMLRYVRAKNTIIELYDTFYFIDEKTASELIDISVHNMLVSLDAATKETYEKIRVGSDFERVTRNVMTFFRLRSEKHTEYPRVAFHYIVNQMNVNEIPRYIELVHSLVQGQKVAIQFTRMLHTFKEVESLYMEIPRQIIEEAERKAKQLGVSLAWNADVPTVKPPVSECKEWIMPFVFATGHVIPCCAGNEAGHRDFQKETALGNVFEQSFKDIWRGPKYRALRKMLREGKAPLPCKNCCIYEVNGGACPHR